MLMSMLKVTRVNNRGSLVKTEKGTGGRDDVVNARIPASPMFSPDGDWVWGLEKENKRVVCPSQPIHHIRVTWCQCDGPLPRWPWPPDRLSCQAPPVLRDCSSPSTVSSLKATHFPLSSSSWIGSIHKYRLEFFCSETCLFSQMYLYVLSLIDISRTWGSELVNLSRLHMKTTFA